MSEQLKRLLQRARLMAPADENGEQGGEKFEYEIEGEEAEEDTQANAEDSKESDKEVVEDEQKDPPTKQEGDDEDEDEDAPEGETEEQKRERRRKERHDRKARQKEREETTKRELAAERRARQELEQRLAQLEGRDRSREIAQVDETIKRANNAYDHWKTKLAEAMEQHDGQAAALATEKMVEAREAYSKLTQFKQNYEKSQGSQNKPNLDPVMVNHAQKFMGEHNWYKHGGADTDSRIVMQLDQSLAEEGWNPSTPEYWDELRARVKKYLPHRIAGGKVSTVNDKQSQRTNKAVVGGGGGESAASGGKVFKLSKERVQALKDAGQWNDPKTREAAIKAYRDYDKANAKKG